MPADDHDSRQFYRRSSPLSVLMATGASGRHDLFLKDRALLPKTIVYAKISITNQVVRGNWPVSTQTPTRYRHDKRRKFLKVRHCRPCDRCRPVDPGTPQERSLRCPVPMRVCVGEECDKPAIDAIKRRGRGELEIELFYANRCVPTGEAFQVICKRGTTTRAFR